MMESMREGVQKPWIKVLLGVAVVSFVFAGVFTAQTFSGSPDMVAVVNGEEVSQRELGDAVNSSAARYGQQFNQYFPTDEAKAKFRRDVLDQYLDSRMVAQEVNEMGFRASGSQIVERVMEIPGMTVDGNLSTAALDQFLVSRGWSRDHLQQIIGESIAQSQFLHVFTDTEIALNYEVLQKLKVEQQERSVKSLVIAAKPFEASVEVTDEDIEAYYQSHLSEYQVQETLSVEYIELKSEDLAAKINVTDEDSKAFYEQNLELYKAEEERRFSNILVSTDEMSEAEAKTKAESILARINAGEDFADLAKTLSDDFSAEDGGDMGFTSKGAMKEDMPEVDSALFALKAVNDVSGVVESSFGFHIIKLTEIKEGSARAFEQVKDQIATRLKSERAEEKFYVTKEKIAQLAFDRYDSLTAAAAEAGLDIKTSEPFPRTGGKGIFGNADLLGEAFGQQVLVDKRNSGAIDISETHMVIVRAKEHTAARTKALDEVKAQVSSAVRLKKAREAAKLLGEELVAQLQTGEAIDEKVAEHKLAWKNAEKLRRHSSELGFEISRLAFTAPKPAEGSVSTLGKEMINGDYAIVQVTDVIFPDAEKLTDAEQKQAKARIQNVLGNSGYDALVKAAREKSSVKVYEERLQ